jgi:pyrroloquinoline quinone biosynthesis protein E
LYPDLERIVRAARARDLYVNLITSGVPLDEKRLDALAQAGVDHVQLSLQSANAETARAIAGGDFHSHKLAVAGWVKRRGLPLTLNVVLHRSNIEEVAELVRLAIALGADRLELANAQYLGWAWHNRRALLPSQVQLARARREVEAARDIEIVFVLPDYLAGRARACMSGWGRRYLVIAPDGKVLPCQAAHVLPLPWERVSERPLRDIWSNSPSLLRFRGESWMEEPCRSCPERARDFGGCRCQAYLVTGEMAAPDPACDKTPQHQLLASPGVEPVEPRRLRLISS